MDAHQGGELRQLLDRVAADDTASFGEFYDLTVDPAYRLARLCADNLAEEVVEDAYRRAWRQRRDFRASRLSPLAWILALTRGSVDVVRARRRV